MKLHLLSIITLLGITIGQTAFGSEHLTGVVISKHIGLGAHPSGQIALASSGRTYKLYYSEPLDKVFDSNTCSDIGAIWSVNVQQSVDMSREIVFAKCTGNVDVVVHGAWSTVRRYLKGSDQHLIRDSRLLSSRWLASIEIKESELIFTGVDLSGYKQYGNDADCIDVVKVQQPNTVELRAGDDCHITAVGRPVDLVFTVRRKLPTNEWSIQRIIIE